MAGDNLAALGDPRFDAEHWHLPAEPLFGFIEIPAGPFMIGSDKQRDEQAYDDELPQHEVNLPGYYVARWPVTVAQFAAFARNSGHEPANPDCLKGTANHPVAYVTWHDALAYCRWLNGQLGKFACERLDTTDPLPESECRFWRGLADGSLGIGLPSEAEWEKAARGDDGRIYPWGGQADPNKANYGDTGLGTTSAVGCFPGGASPRGCEEMSGNVWEWTRSLFDGYPYPQEGPERQAREDLNAPDDASRVLRGGAFYFDARYARCAGRLDFEPGPPTSTTVFGWWRPHWFSLIDENSDLWSRRARWRILHGRPPPAVSFSRSHPPRPPPAARVRRARPATAPGSGRPRPVPPQASGRRPRPARRPARP